jgi:hypothetical protein
MEVIKVTPIERRKASQNRLDCREMTKVIMRTQELMIKFNTLENSIFKHPLHLGLQNEY